MANYSDVLIKKVCILQGKAKDIALKKGYGPDDLVIVKVSKYASAPTYEVEKIEGDPIEYLMNIK